MAQLLDVEERDRVMSLSDEEFLAFMRGRITTLLHEAVPAGCVIKRLLGVKGSELVRELRDKVLRGSWDLMVVPREEALDCTEDGAVELAQLETDFRLVVKRWERVRALVHALVRIENGTYLSCHDCQKPVPRIRILAYPEAVTCLACSSRKTRAS